ncbi:transcription elongation factor Elf1 like-domain-containing protein [Syncephalis fuscata]|nr:transcription elongation factor Elf1 like-domain-containing protein [Syncephalis fuscata]
MGKRKSARKPMTRVRQKLDKQFSCIFCNHEKSIDVKLDKESKVGNVLCRVCSASWQTSINYLSEPVDVYSEWIDACEAAQQEDSRQDYAEDDHDQSAYGRRRDNEDDLRGGNGRETSSSVTRDRGYDDEEDEEDDENYDDDKNTSSANRYANYPEDDEEDEDEDDDGLFG